MHPQSMVKPLNNIKRIGTFQHGYYLPDQLLSKDSICYCVGAGEEISFDTELIMQYGCKVVILDPAPEGVNHFKLLRSKLDNNSTLTIPNHGIPYTYQINLDQLTNISYLEIGVWTEATKIKFYSPERKDYVSHSIELFKNGGKFIEVPVDRISNIMKQQGHTSIDLIKLEIEGAEYRVIETIVEDKIDVKAIAVEFDEVYHKKGPAYLLRIKKSTQLLLNNGYTLAHSTGQFKRLFVRNDIYDQLQYYRENMAESVKEITRKKAVPCM